MLYGLLLFLVVVIIVGAINFQALRRIFGSLRAQLGKAGRAAIEADPEAVLKDRIESGQQTVQDATKILNSSGALVKSLQRQVDQNKSEKTRLENRIRSVLPKLDQEVDPAEKEKLQLAANEYASQLKAVEYQLAQNEAQLEFQKSNYDGAVKLVTETAKKVADAREKARRLGAELAQSEQGRALTELASSVSLDPSRVLGNDNSLDEAVEAIQRKIDYNRSTVENNTVLNKEHLAVAEVEEKVRQEEADEILNRFRAKTDVAG